MRYRYYIPIGDQEFLCIENHAPTRIVRGVPDPFSRVARPRIRWQAVREDLPYITRRELNAAKRARIAYTRLVEEES